MCNLSQGLIEQGIEQGIERGIEQGIELGVKQGLERMREATKKLLPLTQILEVTGLTPTEIEAIKQEIEG